jgi:hypothetical protein
VPGRQADREQRVVTAWALDSEHRMLGVLVDHLHAGRCTLGEPAGDLSRVRCVRDAEDLLVGEEVGDEVVDHAAGVVVARERVLRLTGSEPAQVRRQAGVDVRSGAGSTYGDLPQMADVEDADRLAYRGMLLEHSPTGVLQRHLPPAEGSGTSAQIDVRRMQGRANQPAGWLLGGSRVGHGGQRTTATAHAADGSGLVGCRG